MMSLTFSKLFLVHTGDGSLRWIIYSSQEGFKKHKQIVLSFFSDKSQ